MLGDEINRAIDDVAREMTAGEPRTDLRARAMARIDPAGIIGAGQLQPGRSVGRAAVAAAAVVSLTVFAYREIRPLVRQLRPSGSGVSAARQLSAGHGTPGPRMESPQNPIPVRPAIIEAARRVPARPGMAIAPSPIDQLAPPRIDVAPLAIDDLDSLPIDVPPLESIAPIAVVPLGQGDAQ